MSLTSHVGRQAIGHDDSHQPDYNQYQTIRRNGSVVQFEPAKISLALTKAFLAVKGPHGETSASLHDKVAHLTAQAVKALLRHKPDGGAIPIEDIQDQVELALMRSGEQDVARAYVLYRERRAQERAARREELARVQINVVGPDGLKTPLDVLALRGNIAAAAKGQRQAVEQDGFAGAGFAGQHREPGGESQIKPFNQDDIADRKLDQHPGSYLP